MPNNLTALQMNVLAALAKAEPAPVLFGGAALLGTGLQHRHTRDLDLLWQPCDDLGQMAQQVDYLLRKAGYEPRWLQRAPWHQRTVVQRDGEQLVVDLVARPGEATRKLTTLQLGDVAVQVLGWPDILADKLAALLGRQEGRDLHDVMELLGHGMDLSEGLVAAADIDGGFSVMTLAWVLSTWPMPAVAKAADWSSELAARMAEFRDELVRRLTDLI